MEETKDTEVSSSFILYCCVIAKTASRNVAFKVARLGNSIFERKYEILMTEAVTVNSPSREEDLDDVGCNADLYAFKQDAFQGCSNHESS